MSEANKSIFIRFFDELYNKDNNAVIDELVDSDFVLHDASLPPVEGIEAFRQAVRDLKRAFPCNELTFEDAIAEGDRVVLRWRWKTTHHGDFLGAPATGRRVEFTGISIARFRNGKLVEGWDELDVFGIMKQLAVLD